MPSSSPGRYHTISSPVKQRTAPVNQEKASVRRQRGSGRSKSWFDGELSAESCFAYSPADRRAAKRIRKALRRKAQIVKKAEAQETLSPAGILGMEPLSLAPKRFFRETALPCSRAGFSYRFFRQTEPPCDGKEAQHVKNVEAQKKERLFHLERGQRS